MNKDQIKGTTKEAEGKIRKAAGKMVGNEKLQAKGRIQVAAGKAQAKLGDVKEELKEARDELA